MKKIAIIGANYLQLPLVKKAIEMRIETHCFAWEEGAVCKKHVDYFYPISILEKEKILDICSHLSIDGIISIASDTAVPTVNYVGENLGLISNRFSDSILCTDKFEMRKRFFNVGISCPKFMLTKDGEDDFGNLKFPLIVKPTDRSGSRGVKRINVISDLKKAIDIAKRESFRGLAIIEEYIDGLEVSVESISWQGKHYILAITDKITTGYPHYVELEHHQPSSLNCALQERIKEETCKVLDALNIKYGASHSEFIITLNNEIFAIEVGARMGGDFIGSTLVELSTGYDFLKAVIEIALGCFTEPKLLNQQFSGVYFICSETKHLLDVLDNQSKFNEIVECELIDNELRNVQCSADRSGYFIYQSIQKFVP